MEKGDECDTDDDDDGVVDLEDAFPFDNTETEDTDGDEIGDNADTDDDNDGVLDVDDRFSKIALGALIDTDGDGAPDDCDEACQGTGMTADEDDDGDGIEGMTLDTYPLIAIGELPTPTVMVRLTIVMMCARAPAWQLMRTMITMACSMPMTAFRSSR